jgi:hypothetical protein
MKIFIKILLALFIGIVLTILSLGYESTHELRIFERGGYETRPSWGFPLQYVLDNDVSSPVMSMNEEDTFVFTSMIGNVLFYSFLAFVPFLIFKKRNTA